MIPQLKFDANGLIPAVVQDAATHQVLMVGYMNREALRRTLTSGQAWFWSRSRGELWHKGATSGHYLHVRAVHADCDNDVLLVEAQPDGPTCHTNAPSCFFNTLDAPTRAALAAALAEDAPSAPTPLPAGEGNPVASPAERASLVASPSGRGRPSGARTGEGVPTEGAPLDGRTVEALFDVIMQRQAERPEGSYVVRLLDGGVDRIAKKIGEEATEVVIAAKNASAAELTWEVADLWFHSLVLLAANGLTPADIWQELERRRR